MARLTKRMRVSYNEVDSTKQYNFKDAVVLLKQLTKVNFVESMDVAINLGINVRKSDQNIRGTIVLPHGTGRKIRVAVFAQGVKSEEARIAGADIVGTDDLADQIKKNKLNFDVVIASPDTMNIVSQLGQILGPRGLMPNPKTGTVTLNISEAVKNFKMGQICYRNDKNGIIHTTIGKIDFEFYKLKENLQALLVSLRKIKPTQVKGIYIKKINLSTTMGANVRIDQNSVLAVNT